MGPYHFYDLLLALTRVSADNVGEVQVSWLAPTHSLAKASPRGDSSLLSLLSKVLGSDGGREEVMVLTLYSHLLKLLGGFHWC